MRRRGGAPAARPAAAVRDAVAVTAYAPPGPRLTCPARLKADSGRACVSWLAPGGSPWRRIPWSGALEGRPARLGAVGIVCRSDGRRALEERVAEDTVRFGGTEQAGDSGVEAAGCSERGGKRRLADALDHCGEGLADEPVGEVGSAAVDVDQPR